MLRSFAIFGFFALSTILIIVFQPGPRDMHAQDDGFVADATRNDISVLKPEPDTRSLKMPDDVVTDLKRVASGAPARPAGNGVQGSLDQLQTALTASLQPETVPPQQQSLMLDTSARVAPEQPTFAQTTPAPENIMPSAPPAAAPIEPGLRDMSWNTLNQLSKLGATNMAPGAEGSLLGSIVRRSMTHVSNAPAGAAAVASAMPQATRAPVVAPQPDIQYFRPQRTVSPGMQTYTVTSGDTLALIAIKLYGSALSRQKLLEDNPELKANPDALRIGQVIKYRGG